MPRFLSFMLGLWVGANLLACPLAHGLLFFLTGKLPVPGKGGLRLEDADQAVTYLRTRAQGAVEKYYD